MIVKNLKLEEMYLYCTSKVQALVMFVGSRKDKFQIDIIIYDFKLMRVFWRPDMNPDNEFTSVYSYGLIDRAVRHYIHDNDKFIENF